MEPTADIKQNDAKQKFEKNLEKQLQRQIQVRASLRSLGLFMEKMLTRTTVSGLENIPKQGPVIFAPNHASTYDPVVLANYLPLESALVGPGDFKLLWPGSWLVENSGVITIMRGSVDRDSFKKMEAVLRAGKMLGIFPEGGTWEKRLEDVKSGVAFLSASTGAPIVPIALGGTYQVWKKMFRLQRPHVTIRFGTLLPPVQLSGNRKTRQQELQDASVELMRVIYGMLPTEDQRRYDECAVQRFSATLDFIPHVMKKVQQGVLPLFSGLAELVSKPNLFSPLYLNAGLPLRPFVQKLGRFVPAFEFYRATTALQEAFAGDFQGYLEYRLGDEKTAQVIQDLADLMPLAQEAIQADVAMRFTVNVWLDGEGFA